MSDVLVLNCPNYLPENIDWAVESAFQKLKIQIEPRSKVLVKPNILMAKKPEQACSTHPAVIDAVCKALKKRKCEILIGESSGWNTAQGFEVSGIKAVAEKHGAKIVIFENEKIETKKTEGVILKEIKLASLIDEVDFIVNVPKMKTHMLMKMTGAVKNLYGLVPGFHKAAYHTKGKDETEFGELLIDIYSQVKDKILLNVMDAVVGMEGEGPGNGDPKNTGLILAGTDALSLDVVQAKIMGFDPLEIKSNTAGIKRRLLDISEVKIIGDYSDKKVPLLNYKNPGKGKGFVRVLNTAKSFLIKKPVLIPEVDKGKCIKCGICAKLCPVQCITLSPHPTFDRKICIKCYCCHEHCPKGAIYLKR